jgi:hypothetical protein
MSNELQNATCCVCGHGGAFHVGQCRVSGCLCARFVAPGRTKRPTDGRDACTRDVTQPAQAFGAWRAGRAEEVTT